MCAATQPSTTRSKLRSDNGANTSLTQISKLFPKKTIDSQDESQRAIRKRTADVGVAGASPVKRSTMPSKTVEPKPKEGVISKFFQRKDEADDDFESPKKRMPRVAAPKVAKIKKVSAAKPVKPKRNIKEKFFSAAVEEHSKRDGVDPDELQLALAISRSMANQSERDDDGGAEQDADDFQTQKQKAVHEIFRRFGFKTGTEHEESGSPIVKKRKPRPKWNSRSTVLTRRDPDAQKEQVNARFAKILVISSRPDINQAAPLPYQVGSDYLARFYMIQNIFFESNAETNTKELHEFYTNNLCEISTVPAGALLKDWSLIPGRDPSPEKLSKIDDDEISVDSFVTARSTLETGTSQLLSQNISNSAESPPPQTSALESTEKSVVIKLDYFDELSEISSTDHSIVTTLENPRETTQEIDLTQDSSSEILPNQLCDRSPSPDMFADDDSDGAASIHELNSSPISVPPCSLDPLSSSESPKSSNEMTEEDCVIELYSTGALLMEQLRNQPRAPMTDTESDKECSLDDEKIQLNYSGASEVLSSHNNSTQQQDKTQLNISTQAKECENGTVIEKVKLNVHAVDSEEMQVLGIDKENVTGSYLSQAGIEIFETFNDENEKIGETHIEDVECIEISDDDSEEDFQPIPAKIHVSSQIESPSFSQTLKIDAPDSPLHISPISEISATTDQINFSFDSVASDLDVSFHAQENLLKKSFANRTTTNQVFTKVCETDFVERSLVKDVLNFSFPSEETDNPSERTLTRGKSMNSIKNNNLNTHTSLHCESIELSDEEFSFSINLSHSQPNISNPMVALDDSIEISDDEINYSMSHEPASLPPKSPTCFKPYAANESLQQIFDEDFEADPELLLNFNDSRKEDDFVNQSVRSIVHKEFVNNTKPKEKKTLSGTPIWRTKSDVLGLPSYRPEATLNKLASDLTRPVEFDNDSFDDLLHGIILPTTSTLSTSPFRPSSMKNAPTEEDEQKFTVSHNGDKFEVKIGPRCVTPKPNFEAMDTPTMGVQLKKFGLKPLVRRKAIICLEHIYNRMHPFLECPVEGLKMGNFGVEPLQNSSNEVAENVAIIREEIEELSSAFRIYTTKNPTTSSLPENFYIPFLSEQSEYFLPSAPRTKRAWCLEPLHVAWYNLLRDNPRLFEQVLQYDPLDLKLIRSTLKDNGLLYDANDLITFFDKHCITFRTENTRNKKGITKKGPTCNSTS